MNHRRRSRKHPSSRSSRLIHHGQPRIHARVRHAQHKRGAIFDRTARVMARFLNINSRFAAYAFYIQHLEVLSSQAALLLISSLITDTPDRVERARLRHYQHLLLLERMRRIRG